MNGIKSWEELEIRDDFLFAKVMRDKEICKKILEKLLRIKIKDIKYLEEQKVVDITVDAKSVRLDVYVEDNNRIFNVEMQTTNQKDLSKRSRYYQAMIDLNTIEKGESYHKLKESYVIFICTFDPFGKRRSEYKFENYCEQDRKLKLKDGAKKIFFNTKAYEKEKDIDVREFLKYVNGEESQNVFVQEIEEKVERVKENREWRREYMTLQMREQEIREESWRKGREEGLQRGREEGLEKGREEGLEKGREEGLQKGREEGLEKGREEGLQRGIQMLITSLKSLGISQDKIIEQLMIIYQLDKKGAEDYLS